MCKYIFIIIIEIVEAHPFATESTRTDISISSAEKPGEILYYVDITVTNDEDDENNSYEY